MNEPVAVSQPPSIEARLGQAMQRLRHLAVNLPAPLRLRVPHGDGRWHGMVAEACAGIGVRYVRFVEGELSSFESVISRHVSEVLGAGPSEAMSDSPKPAAVPHRVDREAGVVLHAYASGPLDASPLVLALPFGMPMELCENWFEALARQHRVLSWETRCLFGDCADFDLARVDLDAQVEDLFAVMDHFGAQSAQLMGICGGAAITLAAAARDPGRVDSMSMWFGDFPSRNAALRTSHQANLEWLMDAAARSRDEARDLQKMFVDPGTLATTPPEIAHFSLYPYVDAELFYRYARLNDALNKTDIAPWLERVEAPTLVVTGDSDAVTHAGGSRFVAQGIPGARLVMEPGGSHTAFFAAPSSLVTLAQAFHREHAASVQAVDSP